MLDLEDAQRLRLSQIRVPVVRSKISDIDKYWSQVTGAWWESVCCWCLCFMCRPYLSNFAKMIKAFRIHPFSIGSEVHSSPSTNGKKPWSQTNLSLLTRLLSQHPPLPRVWCCRQELCHQWLYTCTAFARDAWRAWRQGLVVSSSDILAAAAAVFKLFWHTCCCSCFVHTYTRYYS
jgi:hypothetical protein